MVNNTGEPVLQFDVQVVENSFVDYSKQMRNNNKNVVV